MRTGDLRFPLMVVSVPDIRDRKPSPSHGLVGLMGIAALLFGPPALAQTLSQVGEGRVPIVEGRRLEARRVALSEALHDALHLAVAELVGIEGSRLTAEDRRHLEEQLGNSVNDYVAARAVVSETVEGDLFILRLRTDFQRSKLQGAVSKIDLRNGVGSPVEKISVLIQQQTRQGRVRLAAAEASMLQPFTERGYRAVQLLGDGGNSLDEVGIRGLGQRSGADIVIVGEASCSELRRTKAGIPRRARVDTRMIRTDTGDVLATFGSERTALATGAEAACQRAVQEGATIVGNYLATRLEAARSLGGGYSRIALSITNIPFTQYERLRNALESQIDGASGARIRAYQDLRMELETEFAGSAETLAQALAAHDFGTFELRIARVTTARIELEAKER